MIRAAAQGVLIAWVFIMCAKIVVRGLWSGDESVRPWAIGLSLYVAIGAGMFIGGDEFWSFMSGLVPGL